jgi:hypothetical protein
MPFPTVDQVKESLEYRDGKLFWRRTRPREHFASIGAWKRFLARHAGHEAGYQRHDLRKGDIRFFVTIFGQEISRAVVVWILHYGCYPNATLDHANRVSFDDRVVENLRLCSSSENGANRVLGCNSTSGLKGASYHRASGKWQSNVRVHGRLIYLGLHPTRDEAHAAYVAASLRYFGPFACAG